MSNKSDSLLQTVHLCPASSNGHPACLLPVPPLVSHLNHLPPKCPSLHHQSRPRLNIQVNRCLGNSEFITTIVQQKRVQESCNRSQCDYYIAISDIIRIRQIVENEDICLDDDDAISVRLWIMKLWQSGAEVTLKDKLDPPPPGSGLSPDSFVLCIQTTFQRAQFQALGSHFLSIDATHNTTQYVGLQLYTLIVRDLWGHGTLCGVFPLLGTDSFPIGRRPCRMDDVVKWHGSDSSLLHQFCKIAEPRDQTHDYYE